MSLEILQAIASGRPDLALCTVVQVKGSAPRHVGSKMLAGPEGLMAGSVGGGRGEAAALAACVEALATRRPAVLQIEMQGTEAEGPDMVCGGFSRILVEPLSDPAPYRAALDLVATGARALLVKRVETGETAVLGANGQWASGQLEGLDPARALGSLETGHAALIEDAGLFVDPVLPREKLLILGGGHVGRALAAIAPGLGFAVTVADERLEFLEPERFPAGVETRLGSFPQIVASYPFDLSTYVVIVTRGHLCDLERGPSSGSPTGTAGLMGSRRKTRLMVEQLLRTAPIPARVDALYAPIGQEIGAETPEELAVAIAGELIAVRHGAACLAAQRVGAAGEARRPVILVEALGPLLPAGSGVVAFVGAGGKTTAMLRLARELEEMGQSVLESRRRPHLSDPRREPEGPAGRLVFRPEMESPRTAGAGFTEGTGVDVARNHDARLARGQRAWQGQGDPPVVGPVPGVRRSSSSSRPTGRDGSR